MQHIIERIFDESDVTKAALSRRAGLAVDRALIEQSNVERVRHRFRAAFPEYIWDAAALKGNPYTLPEVQTLLEGVTVTGHRIADQNQILASAPGDGGPRLAAEFDSLTAYLFEDLDDTREQAIAYFCSATRRHTSKRRRISANFASALMSMLVLGRRHCGDARDLHAA